ncbi:hypothetical protein MSAN_01510100 [Mycena sanguinolenta]|uniref:Uncharacterized protein n=1 Tax=Mycena sanguinolenta TaxID=230812 RepID=A0A8H6Y332_9AGAR|nr:hypothetical protein MSAN_01510100 [Mycena sanguinolenta]
MDSNSHINLDLVYPNAFLGATTIAAYEERFHAGTIPPTPIQFPHPSHVDTEMLLYHHRSPAFVPWAPSSPVPGSPDTDSLDRFITAFTGAIETILSPSSPASPSTDSFSSPQTPPSSPTEPNLSVVPAFSPSDGWLALNNVLADPILRERTWAAVGSPLRFLEPTAADSIPVYQDGVPVAWNLRPELAEMIEDSLRREAYFLLCASNNHDPYRYGGPPDLPTFHPREALEEARISIPGISLFRMYRMAEIQFTDPEDPLDFVRLARWVYNYNLNLIADIIRKVVHFGYRTFWRFGAPLGMAHTEFTHRITRYFTYDGYTALEWYLQHDILQNEMDFAAAILLSSGDLRLLRISRCDLAWICIWPYRDLRNNLGDILLNYCLTELGWTVDTLAEWLELNEPKSIEQ